MKILSLLALLIAGSPSAFAESEIKTAPNVLFITIDDMNDGVSLFGKDKPFKTPQVDALAKRGVFFSRAYCTSAACNPSRASMLTGLRPHETGIYGNKTDWRAATKGHLTIPEYFRKQGYHTAGFGKIYHHQYDGAFNDPDAWDNFKKMTFRQPFKAEFPRDGFCRSPRRR